MIRGLCKDCRYAFKDEVEKKVGACRKSPPTPVNMMTPKGPMTIGVWPPTQDKNWCGEFAPTSHTEEIAS